MSSRKAVSIGLVVLLHALIGYAFITGLAYNVVKKSLEDLKTFDVKEEPPPPPEKPPPPPPEQPKVQPPPPVVAPPPIVQAPVVNAPQISNVPKAPPPVITPTAPPAPPPPPVVSQAANAKGDPKSWITNDDYPAAAAREQRSGVSAIAWQINEQGKVENCHVTSSSGSQDLDDTACRLITRRGKYSPAKDQNGNPIRSTSSIRFRWVLPD